MQGGIYLSAYGRKLPVRVIFADDESSPEKGVECVTKLITRDQVNLLSIVSILPIVLAEVEVSERYKVPCLVCSGFDKPYEERSLEKPWQYVWIEAMSLEGMIRGCLDLLETVKTNRIIALHAIDNPDGRYPGTVLEDIAKKAKVYRY